MDPATATWKEVSNMATRKVHRSAISGRFVKKATTQRRPKTTVTQTVRTPRKKK